MQTSASWLWICTVEEGYWRHLPALSQSGWARPTPRGLCCLPAAPVPLPAALAPVGKPSGSLRGRGWEKYDERWKHTCEGNSSSCSCIWNRKEGLRGLSPVLMRGRACSTAATANLARLHCCSCSSSESSASISGGSSGWGCGSGDCWAGLGGAPLWLLLPLYRTNQKEF